MNVIKLYFVVEIKFEKCFNFFLFNSGLLMKKSYIRIFDPIDDFEIIKELSEAEIDDLLLCKFSLFCLFIIIIFVINYIFIIIIKLVS